MEVENMKTPNGNTAPNQFLIHGYDSVTFQSYKSKIADYNRRQDELIVYEDWDYSKTTLKYFKQFINTETSFNYENVNQWREEMKNNPKIEVV